METKSSEARVECLPEGMTSRNTCIWALSDGRAGNVAMALGLAERVAALTGGVVERKDLQISGANAWLSARFPWFPSRLQMVSYAQPAVVIGAGRRVAPAVAAMGKAGAKAVQILNPQMALTRFDLVVAPEHDGLSAANVISTLGSVGRVTEDSLFREKTRFSSVFAQVSPPVISVLIGGSTKRTTMTPAMTERLADDLAGLSDVRLLITASRRTGGENTALLRARLPGAWFWDGTGDNPYFAMLGTADAIIVTDDSVNMASEAAATGKPVAIYPLLKEGGKIARFHEALIARGHAQWFDGGIPTASAGPLDETGRAAQAVAALL